MFSFQSQTAKSASQKHHGHSSSGVGPPWLSMPGTWEGPGRKCSGDHRPFHQVHSGICNKDTNSTNDSKDPIRTNLLSTMVYLKRFSPIRDEILRVSWWMTSVSWWGCRRYGPVCIICRPMVNVRGSTPLWSICLGLCPRERNQSGRTMLVHAYNCIWNSATGFSPYYLMFGRQPCLPVDVALGLAPHTIMEPNTSKFIQKLREHTKWAHEKAEAFQAKEAQRHKCNYDKRSRAAALEVGDMVLVHVTAFKGHHKMQERWENREYVVEKQPYPNIPVYVVCPRDGEGHSWTLHRNCLLPINSNVGQDEADGSEERVKNNTSLTLLPSADNSTQNSPDRPAPVRHSTQTTRNQLPKRYQNFGLSAGTGPTGIWDAWVDLCVCLLILACLYTAFRRGAV